MKIALAAALIAVLLTMTCGVKTTLCVLVGLIILAACLLGYALYVLNRKD